MPDQASIGQDAYQAAGNRLRAGEEYGAAKASRTARAGHGRESAVVPRTKVGVLRHTDASIGRVRAIRIRGGAGDPAGWCTAVLVSTTPASWSRWARAQPSETVV